MLQAKYSSVFCQIFIKFSQVHNVRKHLKYILTFDNPVKSLIWHRHGSEHAELKSSFYGFFNFITGKVFSIEQHRKYNAISFIFVRFRNENFAQMCFSESPTYWKLNKASTSKQCKKKEISFFFFSRHVPLIAWESIEINEASLDDITLILLFTILKSLFLSISISSYSCILYFLVF